MNVSKVSTQSCTHKVFIHENNIQTKRKNMKGDDEKKGGKEKVVDGWM